MVQLAGDTQAVTHATEACHLHCSSPWTHLPASTMASSPPMSKSPSRSAAALQPSKSDTNLAASAFAAYPQYAAHPQGAAPPSAGPSATERPSSPNSLALAAAAAAAASSAQHPHHAPLIPSYPYNLSMSSPFIPGCSSSDPRLFEQHAPDDSSVQTRLPSIAVDYLSHDWKEDDVWASWKAMTKHKSELANGVRLENASWRTWAKQRGKLKTISPETLNWCVLRSIWLCASLLPNSLFHSLQAQRLRCHMAIRPAPHSR